MKLGTIGEQDINLGVYETFWFILCVSMVPITLICLLIAVIRIFGII